METDCRVQREDGQCVGGAPRPALGILNAPPLHTHTQTLVQTILRPHHARQTLHIPNSRLRGLSSFLHWHFSMTHWFLGTLNTYILSNHHTPGSMYFFFNRSWNSIKYLYMYVYNVPYNSCPFFQVTTFPIMTINGHLHFHSCSLCLAFIDFGCLV